MTAKAPRIGLTILLAAGIAWAEWATLAGLARRWSTDARYSHGFLVPMFAAALLWLRREQFPGLSPSPSWWSIPLLAVAAALQMAGGYLYMDWLEGMAILPYAAGLCVLLCGARSLRWAGPSIAFLFFMIPLPYRVEVALGGGLQMIATKASTYALQTMGLPAVAEGNIIYMSEATLGVAEACSGLGMLSTFFAFSIGAALIVRRRWTDKAFLVLSAIPIAVLVNVTRITATGVLHETVGGRVAGLVFHDLAGWLMMPLALALIWLLLVLLSYLLVEPQAAPSVTAVAGGAPRPDRRGARRYPGPLPGR